MAVAIWGILTLCMTLWLMGARTAVEASGTLDMAVFPLQNLYLLDPSSGQLFWQSRYGEQNSTWQVNNSVLAQGIFLRNDTAYQQQSPRVPSAVAIGVKVLGCTQDGRLCEYDTSQQGLLLRCVQLPEVPNDIVHLPAVSAQDPEKLLVALPRAQLIGLVDYQSFQYVGTWASFQRADNISMEYSHGMVLVAQESRDAVLLYDRQGTLQIQSWVLVPRPRYLSVVPTEDMVYVSSAEADGCAVYSFRASDASSVAVVSLSQCDTQRQVYSFGVDQGIIYRLYRDQQRLRGWSIYTGAELAVQSPMSLRDAALTRSDDETGELGLLDVYSWHASVTDQPLALSACQNGGATLTSQTLALFACRHDPMRLIVVDPQSAYALYRQQDNTATSLCFQRHFTMGTAWQAAQYDPDADVLQLQSAGTGGLYQLTGVCADALSIPLLPVTTALATCRNGTLAQWCQWDSMRGFWWWRLNDTQLYRQDGTLVQIRAPMALEDTLLMDRGQLFALVQQESGVELFWLRVLDSNVSQGEWIDAGQVTDQLLGNVRVGLRAYDYVPPLASEVYKCAGVEECLARNPLLLAFLVIVSLITIVVVIVVVVLAIVRRQRDTRGAQFSTDFTGPPGRDEKPLPVLRWVIRQLFCQCHQCYESEPPGKLRFLYCCLGGTRERVDNKYRVMDDRDGGAGNNVYVEPPSGPGNSLLPDSAAQLRPPAPPLPAAASEPFLGRSAMVPVDLGDPGKQL